MITGENLHLADRVKINRDTYKPSTDVCFPPPSSEQEHESPYKTSCGAMSLAQHLGKGIRVPGRPQTNGNVEVFVVESQKLQPSEPFLDYSGMSETLAGKGM